MMISIKGTLAPLQCRTCHLLQTKLLQCETHFRQHMFISTQTHYEALSLKRTASQRDIKDAFIKFSKLTHPDLHPNNPEKHKKFVRVNEAYEVLSSPVKRKEYDESLSYRTRYHPGSTNEPFTQSYHRHYQEYRKNPNGNRGNRDFDEETFRGGGWYDYQTGKQHLYNDGSTASMSANDWKNVFRFAKYLASFVVIMNSLYLLAYVKQRNTAKRRNGRLIDHKTFLSAEEAEKMRLQHDLHREQLKKKKQTKKKKKTEDPEYLNDVTSNYEVPTATIK